jgi:FMN-dependent oxidoreductase (nitrilotriacetate monooxygenase family)
MHSQLGLGAFLYPTGYHVAAWRHPDVPADGGIDVAEYARLASIAESAAFDFVFLPDSLAVRGRDLPALSRTAIRYVAQLEPLTLLGALSATTRRIGLIATATTTYHEPYHVARMFASLDHISRGRAGWNVITSQNEDEAFNFGTAGHLEHGTRYHRAGEFVEVVRKLWDSWEDDAFLRDKASGTFFDPARLHVPEHQGEHFAVRGPLNVPRPPQGHPVVVQSGSSEAGIRLAAATADVVFTAQATLSEAKQFSDEVRRRSVEAGRTDAGPRIYVGVFPYVAPTHSAARDLHAQLQRLVEPEVGISLLEGQLGGVDLRSLPLDGPLPTLPNTNAGRSRQHLLLRMAQREHLSIRDLYLSVAGSRGHWQLIGTGPSVADELQHWHQEGAADGFIVIPPLLPDGLRAFVDLVVPELVARKSCRAGYEGATLRDHLGLLRPGHPKSQVATG